MHIDGACHCGAISFTATINTARVALCHCSDCQVLSGAPFRAVAMAPYASLRVRGEPKTYIKQAQSGNRRAQVFCPECGTPLWAAAPENPVAVMIRLGCVRQREQLVPTVQIWHHSALPWLADLAGVPTTPEGSGFAPPTGPSTGAPAEGTGRA